MKENTLPKKTVILWQIRVMLITLALVAIILIFSHYFKWLFIAAIVILTLGLLFGFVYFPLFFKSYRIILNNDSVIVKYGVFIKVDHIMPYKRMIYAQSIETPLARIFKVSAVKLKAARSGLIIAEIDKSSAQSIINFLAEGERDE